ncbi:MAG: 4'-phosphopantetheinyl transferase superfamily protein [Paludibacteraceae bacterium]|nr:4'-phosphopantetheinyl transferase superfamily protein [Paludibacteraceae bacterium]
MKVAIFDRMEECTEAEVARLLPLVSAQRREQALQFKHTFGQFCCLKSWLMLQELMENGQWQMANWLYNEHGKPYIENGPFFSISHCKESIAVAVDEQPVGVDIEGVRHADDELIWRTMNEEEQAEIFAAKERDRAFTRFWTQKEAIVKCLGTGIESFEQLQGIRSQESGIRTQTFEKEKYIYSIATKE